MRAAALLLAAPLFAPLLLAPAGSPALAAPAYVTDELVLGVYAEQSTQGQRLATLHSGASVETLAVSGEATQVRLPDGKMGWVKSAYLTTREPAAVRIKQLQDELDRNRATTPALAEAAERSEVARLTRELAARQAESSIRSPGSPDTGTAAVAARPMNTAAPPSGRALDGPLPTRLWVWLSTLGLALACGFWMGYALLARRIRERFGGIRVY